MLAHPLFEGRPFDGEVAYSSNNPLAQAAWRRRRAERETARYGCDMSKHGDAARNGGPGARGESAGSTNSPPPEPPPGEPKSDYERTLAALRASPSCRRIITSGPTLVWMLSSPAQLAALKSALKR